MRYQKIGLSLFGAIAVLAVILAAATTWLFLTSPMSVASAVGGGEITPLVQELAAILVQAFAGLLKYL